jgi:hypothetical protein
MFMPAVTRVLEGQREVANDFMLGVLGSATSEKQGTSRSLIPNLSNKDTSNLIYLPF